MQPLHQGGEGVPPSSRGIPLEGVERMAEAASAAMRRRASALHRMIPALSILPVSSDAAVAAGTSPVQPSARCRCNGCPLFCVFIVDAWQLLIVEGAPYTISVE